jgi:carbon storage regulator
MLILTRRIGEVVMVGDEIKVVVVGAVGTQVRLGIEAPREVAVHREEIYEKVKREEGRRAAPQGTETPDAPSEDALLAKIRALDPERRTEVASYIDDLLRERNR